MLPKRILSGSDRRYDFYPLHDPEDQCYAHTVVACKLENHNHEYVEPTQSVKNQFKALFVASLRPAKKPILPILVFLELKKYFSVLFAPRR